MGIIFTGKYGGRWTAKAKKRQKERAKREDPRPSAPNPTRTQVARIFRSPLTRPPILVASHLSYRRSSVLCLVVWVFAGADHILRTVVGYWWQVRMRWDGRYGRRGGPGSTPRWGDGNGNGIERWGHSFGWISEMPRVEMSNYNGYILDREKVGYRGSWRCCVDGMR